MLQVYHVNEELTYDGSQLVPHWIFRNFLIQGNTLVSFLGPCWVDTDSMVDLADVMTGETIYSPWMLHFIGEFFDNDLDLMVLRQRLFIITIKEELEDRNIPGRIIRNGDDLYYISEEGEKGKLTVSIATRSLTSTLMHTGINIETTGTPVPAAGLNELGVEPVSFGKKVASRFVDELNGIFNARCKVKGVQ
jgi:uncharacterized protein